MITFEVRFRVRVRVVNGICGQSKGENKGEGEFGVCVWIAAVIVVRVSVGPTLVLGLRLWWLWGRCVVTIPITPLSPQT